MHPGVITAHHGVITVYPGVVTANPGQMAYRHNLVSKGMYFGVLIISGMFSVPSIASFNSPLLKSCASPAEPFASTSTHENFRVHQGHQNDGVKALVVVVEGNPIFGTLHGDAFIVQESQAVVEFPSMRGVANFLPLLSR